MNVIGAPAIPVAVIVVAIAPMGVHLAFFFNMTTGPDDTNDIVALAFGVLFVVLPIGGSAWIMAATSHNRMQRSNAGQPAQPHGHHDPDAVSAPRPTNN